MRVGDDEDRGAEVRNQCGNTFQVAMLAGGLDGAAAMTILILGVPGGAAGEREAHGLKVPVCDPT